MTFVETDLRRGRVRVITKDDQQHVQTVLLADVPDAWANWAREMRFALSNTNFIDVGNTVYRCDTIARIDPINEGQEREPMYEALQACIAVLTAIRDGEVDAREMAAVTLTELEGQGWTGI